MPTDAPADSPLRALGIALCIALVCALVVSVAAVSLRPRYLANLEAERFARLDATLATLGDAIGSIGREDIEPRVVRLDDGSYDDGVDPDLYDAVAATRDPDRSIALPADRDTAGIGRRANHAVIYLARRDDGSPRLVILPVVGTGYQSALRGYLAMDGDGNEILALRFYEQGETPGLGSRIQEPDWEALWQGKQAYADDGSVGITVGGTGRRGDPFHVDGISGATRTTRGVNGLVRFWLGELGFGPYLRRLRRGEA